MSWVSMVVLFAYASLVVELVFFHVPSVASSQNLWKIDDEYNGELRKANINTENWSLGRKTIFLFLPIVFIVSTFLYPISYLTGLIPTSWHTTLWIHSQLLISVAIGLIIIGRLITFTSVLAIRKDNSQMDDEFELHEDSLYGKSRNPIQLGMYIFGIGLLMLFPHPLFILGLIFYVCYMHYKIRIEEDFLTVKFGAAYVRYMQNTRRYF